MHIIKVDKGFLMLLDNANVKITGDKDKASTFNIEKEAFDFLRRLEKRYPDEFKNGVVKMLPFRLLRTASGSTVIGYIKYINGREAEILNSRQILMYKSFCQCEHIALNGFKDEDMSNLCKKMLLTNIVEILDCSKQVHVDFENMDSQISY